MFLIAHKCEILQCKVVNIRLVGIELEGRKRKRCALKLLLQGFHVVGIYVCVAESEDKLTGLEATHFTRACRSRGNKRQC